MKNIAIKVVLALGALLSLTSCDKWLGETVSTSNLTDQVIWEDAGSVDLYINGFYTYLYKYGTFGTTQFQGSLTESLTDTFKYGSMALGAKAGHPNEYVCHPEDVTADGGGLYGIWGTGYENVRRINEFIQTLHTYSKFSEAQNTLWEAQARFFRAFVYFQLAKRHPKGIILYTDLNMTNDKARSSAEEMWNLIASDLDYAAENLPEEWNTANKGRATKYAALAFKSRAMLYAERWQDAYDAAKAVVESGKYGLMPTYQEAFKGNNKEAILEFRFAVNGPNHQFDQDNVPLCDGYDYGGLGTPTQEMVETYEKADGTDYDWSGYHDGTVKTRPNYESLEPRFHATVIYPGCTWKGHVMENCVDGAYGSFIEYGSLPYTYGMTTTGYFLRKMVDETHIDLKGIRSTTPWIEIRYAEVLLNLSEAAFRLGLQAGEYRKYMNEVRARVNLPEKNSASDQWFEDYRRERKVELSYEGHLFWDMRRWKLAHIEYSNYKVHGFKIDRGVYEYIPCDFTDRSFLQRLYCLPIPVEERVNNKLIEQYDEWK